MNTYNRLGTQEIGKACDAFWARRGEKKVSFREIVNRDAQEGYARRHRKGRKESDFEKVAREIENNSKG
tara:strand:+ start:204 stop:410 length:207 start_codon:yes stop_codon:yes gene_type:complete